MCAKMNFKDVLLSYLCDDINKWILREAGNYIYLHCNNTFEKITKEINISKLRNNHIKIIFCDRKLQRTQFVFGNDDLEIIYFWHRSNWHKVNKDSFDICTFDELAVHMMDNCPFACCEKYRNDSDKSYLVNLFSEFDTMKYIFRESIGDSNNEIIIEI